MGVKMYDELKDMLCEELEKIVQKGELSAGSLETVHKLTDTIKNVDKIEMLEESNYSEADGEWSANGTYARDNGRYSRSYDRGSSYARRGTHYVRGHYSRDAESMKQRIRDMMDEGDMPADVRDTLRKAMDMLNR